MEEQKIRSAQEAIERIEEQVRIAVRQKEDLDSVSWYNRQGALIPCQMAKDLVGYVKHLETIVKTFNATQ